MKSKNPTLPKPQQTLSACITAGSLPAWEETPPVCQQELVRALAEMLLHLPELKNLLGGQHDPQQ